MWRRSGCAEPINSRALTALNESETVHENELLGGKMLTIGIRAAPSAVTFAVYDSDRREIINVEEIVIPVAFDVPDALKYVRSNLLDVLREFQVERAGLRVTEPFAQQLSIERVKIEGVIQEAFASSALQSYYMGTIATMAGRIGENRDIIKPMVKGAVDPGVEGWAGHSEIEREAILCAMGAVNA